MKLIFLDFDGVLALCHKQRDEFGSLFHSEFVDNLKSIIDSTNAKIVISSTWRSDGFDQMLKMWEYRKMPGELIGITGFNELRFRGLEIEKYLENVMQFQRVNYSKELQETYLETSKCKNYVILDDDSDMTYNQKEHFVKCSCQKDEDSLEGYGLTKRVATEAIKILNTSLIDLYYE